MNRMSVVFVFRCVTTQTKFDSDSGLRKLETNPSILEEIKHSHLHRGLDKKKFQYRIQNLYNKVFH